MKSQVVAWWAPSWDETIVLGDPDASGFAVAYVAGDATAVSGAAYECVK